MIGIDPVEIRKALVAHHAKGTPWDKAWLEATGHNASDEDERRLYVFMEKHFRAAYHNTPSSLGRCNVPERDVSNLLERTHVPVPSNRTTCRSGDECPRPATRGRFGKHFCEHHGAELERLAVKLADARAKADPRNNGNTSLFTHRAA